MLIKVQHEDFELSLVNDYFKQCGTEIGAVVTFTGLVRDFQHQPDDKERVEALTLEHYPGMTESVLTQLAEDARSRWSLNEVVIIHRVGTLYPGDNIVLVATASAHRQDAFNGCQFIMDSLKTTAPFWKKEQTSHGARWVDAKQSDQSEVDKWLTKNTKDQKVN